MDESARARYEALVLNLGVSDVAESFLVAPEEWARCEVAGLPERAGPYVLGLDLGQSGAMTAAAAYWPLSGALDAFGVVGGLPDLRERGRRDNVGALYVDMARRGELFVHAGLRVPDYGQFVGQVLARWGVPSAISADRYREAELRDVLDAGRMPPRPLVVRGQGWRDGGEDVSRFRRAVLSGRVVAPRSLLVRSALSEARTVADVAGNVKLAKGTEGGRRKLGRDDVAAAAVLAVAEGDRRPVPSVGGPRLVAV